MNSPTPVPTPAPVTAGALPWYRSPVYVLAGGIVLAALGNLFPQVKRLVQQAGFTSTSDVLEFIGAVATLIGGIVIAIVRWWAKVQPLVLTRRAAAIHPATIAVVETQQAMANAGIPTAAALQATIEASPKVQPSSEIPK